MLSLPVWNAASLLLHSLAGPAESERLCGGLPGH